MKKIIYFLLAVVMVLSFTACSKKADSDKTEQKTINITSLNAAGEAAEITVPYDPQRIAVLDLAALDILDNLGLGDRVVGSATTTLDYLKKYTTSDSITNLGTIKEADLEAVMSCQPDIIFIGGRLNSFYDELSAIAPVVYLATDSTIGVVESTRKNALLIASIFGKEAEIEQKLQGFDGRIAALKKIADGKTAVVGMCTNGGFNVIGNGGRCSIIGVEVGFNNLCNSSNNNSAHGSESSFELIVSLNPDYIFVMDRDSAIGSSGAKLAKDIMENELVMSTDAYKKGNLVILENPAAWYTAEGGVTALDIMLGDLEKVMLQ